MRLLPLLRDQVEVVVWTSQAEWSPGADELAEVRRFYPGSLPWRELDRADATFFQIGNSSMYHRDIWQVCREYPGIAVLHDVLLHDAIVNHCRIAPEVKGAYPDGWTSARLTVAFAAGERGRRLTLRLRAPDWITSDLSVVMLPDTARAVAPGGSIELTRDLPPGGGTVELRFSPVSYVPGDNRPLSARLECAVIQGPGGQVLLNGRERYFEILESLYGARGRRDAELHWRGVLSLDQMARVYDCVRFLLPSARAAAVHSRMAERIVRREKRRLPVVRLNLDAPLRGVPEPHGGPPPWRLAMFGYLGPNRALGHVFRALSLLEKRGAASFSAADLW